MLIRLAAWVFGAIALTSAASAAVIAMAHRPAWWSGWVAATAISLLAAVLAMAPLVPALFAGVQYAAYGYLAGALLRILASLLGGLAAVLIFRTPPVPTLLLLVPPYLAQLVAEVVVLSRVFWPRR